MLVLIYAGLALVAVLAMAAPAHTHALLVRSDPPANQLVLQAPRSIVLEFSEPVNPERTDIRVLTQDGVRIDRQRPQFTADRRGAQQPVELPGPGIYTVVWRTLSTVDLHTYEGFFTFTLGPLRPGSFAQRAGVPGTSTPTSFEIAARWLMFLAGAAFAGGVVMHRFVLPAVLGLLSAELRGEWAAGLYRRWRAAAWLSAAAFMGGALWELGALGLRVAASTGGELLTVVTQFVTAEPARTSLLIKLAVPLVLLGLSRRPVGATVHPSFGHTASSIWRNSLSALELTLPSLMLLGISLTSHAAASGLPGPLLADWLHLISAGTWVGGLFYLAAVLAPLLPRIDPGERARLLGPLVQRFSNLALASVAALVLSGVYAAWVNIPSVQVVGTTAYGRTLAMKIALLIPLLGIAGVNLFVMRPRLAAAARQAVEATGKLLQRRFLILVRAEASLASLVLLAAAALALLPTARQVEALAIARAPLLLRQSETGLEGLLRTRPYQVGENTFELRLRHRNNLPVADARVEISFLALLDESTGTTTPAEPQGDGGFVLRGNFINAKGPWLVTATVHWRGQVTRLFFPVEPDWERGTAAMPPSDPDALAMLRKADAVMNGLRSLRQRQEIADGSGNDVVTFFELAATDRMHYRVIGGLEVIMLGTTQFVREDGSWRREVAPVAFTFPNFTFVEAASNVVFGPRGTVEGRPAQVVTFVMNVTGSRARYAVWIDLRTSHILREFMVARWHYMIIWNYDFNAPVTIRRP